MPLPAFTAIKNLSGNDPVDGATNYNTVEAGVEKNNDLFNAWLTATLPVFNSTPAVTKVADPASGWAMDTGAARLQWGRKWGGLTFISVSVMRTGATIPAGSAGNITDTPVCTLISGWRPPHTLFISGNYHGYGPCGLVISSTGVITVHTMGCPGVALQTSRYLLFNCMWENLDIKPIT